MGYGQIDFDEREVVLRVDFSSLDDEDCPWVPMRFLQGPRHPREGEPVYLLDGEGRGCVGEVLQITGWMARVKPDWSTWAGSDGERPPQTG